ncbi:MAG: glycyl-radical enzyme activating protein [Deltaproteobacteria bacterium]|nr:glycyl-radical enzyme activating protein [Deltaproteobacteria bacterium]
MSNLPIIVDIKRHSLEDGPGIRSVVFFKGCLLRCVFCQNQEAQNPEPEIIFSGRKCIACMECADVCRQDAIDFQFSGRILRERCIRCGKCADICPSSALKLIGVSYSTDALTELLLRDTAFYRHSGGGVTLSGGECTLYPDYLETLLKLLKAEDIHIVLETSGYFDYDVFREKILPYIDLIYYDIKIFNTDSHRRYTGKPNHSILKNLSNLLKEDGIEVHPRIPIIPDITATGENLTAIVDFLYEAGADTVSLLPYNPMGMEMAVSLGRMRPKLPEGFMKPEKEKDIYL